MKKHSIKKTPEGYDFSNGRRGAVLPPEPMPAGKARITIRIDEDILDYFLKLADENGGAVGYQTLINRALREQMTPRKVAIEEVREVVREELAALTLAR